MKTTEKGMTSPGFRNRKRENPFVQIDKGMLSDEKISWKAKGILAYLLSKPDDWVTYAKDIEKRSTDGRDSVNSGIKELIAAGYLERKQLREKGKFTGYEYSVYESPLVVEPAEKDETENGNTVNGFSENGKAENGKPATSNNNLSNNDLNNNNLSYYNNSVSGKGAFQFFEKNGFGFLTPHVGEKIMAWIDDLNEELVIHAMQLSVENSALNWNYTEKILHNWHKRKFTSVEQVLAAEVQRKKRNQSNGNGRRNYGGKEELIPEWFKKDEAPEVVVDKPSVNKNELEERRRRLQEELGNMSPRGVKQ